MTETADSPRSGVHPYRVALFCFAVAVGLWLVPQMWGVAFTVFATVVFAIALDVPVSALSPRFMPRSVATGLVVTGTLVAVVGAVVVIAPSVADQMATLHAENGDLGSALVVRLNEALASLPFDVPGLDPESFTYDALKDRFGTMDVVMNTTTVLTELAVAAVAAVWAVANPAPLLDRLVTFIPADRRDRTRQVATAVERRLRGWIAGQLTLCVSVGLATYVLLRALGVPFAALFAVAAAFLEAVPAVGILIASIPPVAVTLLHDPGTAVWLVVGIIAIQQAEDRFLVPTVMRRAVDLPPTLVVLTLFAFGGFFGPAGMFVAVPVTAAAIAIFDEVAGGRPGSRREAGAHGELPVPSEGTAT